MEPKFTGATAPAVGKELPPEAQQRGSHHRRAHSDSTFRVANFDDLLLFDASDLDISELPSPLPLPNSKADDAAGLAVGSVSDGRVSRPVPVGPSVGHLRSLSVDSEFFDGFGLTGGVDDGERLGGKGFGERRVGHHRRSNSMDGSSTDSFDADSPMAFDVGSGKKVMGPEKLAELARIDPKKAKRILANRQSAARSKERKIRYTNELEKKVQTLQSEATSLSAQVTMLQRDTTDLTAENKELKLRIEALRQQAQLRDALNEAMKEELQRLKIQTSTFAAANGNPSFGGLLSQFSSQLALHQLNNPPSQHQAQQQPQLCMPPPPSQHQVQQQPQLRMLPPPSLHQARQQPQLRIPPPPSHHQAQQQPQLLHMLQSPSGQPFNGHCVPNFSDFSLQN